MKMTSSENRKMTKIRDRLSQLLNICVNEYENLKNEVSNFPEGKLVIKKNKSSFVCYSYQDNKEKFIKMNDQKLVELARKTQALSDYQDMATCIESINTALLSIENYMNNHKNKKGSLTLKKLPSLFKIEDFALNKTEKDFLKKYSVKTNYKQEELKYETLSGIKVRSKSERMIANALYENDVVFIYEPVLKIRGRTIIPDFLILCDDGRIVIWEHFGLLNQEEYYLNAKDKIDLYGKIGYKQNYNLICTDEKDIQSKDWLQKIIDVRIKL